MLLYLLAEQIFVAMDNRNSKGTIFNKNYKRGRLSPQSQRALASFNIGTNSPEI